MTDNNKNRIGLQIGGAVGVNDEVGMHIVMPTEPGVAVEININNIIKKIEEDTPKDHPKVEEIKKITKEILQEENEQTKLQKIQTLIATGAGVTQIADGITKLAKFF